jgi:predicted glycoside hydrolase/deacetylase ChbG (UPF0249 family)
MEQQRVTSATLLVNAPMAEAAASQISRFPQCSFGVHLNAMNFKPLSTHPGLKPLLNEEGDFAGNIRWIPLTSTIRQGVFAEWCAQIKRAMALGISVSHLDSHFHVHTLPGLFGVLKRVQREFGIRKVRISRNLAGSREPMPRALRASKGTWNFALRRFYSTRTANGFTSFGEFYDRLQAGLKLKGTLELMCHPGAENCRAETELLSTPWQDEVPGGVQLISYNEL